MSAKRKGQSRGRRPGGSGRKKDRKKGNGGKTRGKEKPSDAVEGEKKRPMVMILAIIVVIIVIIAAISWFLFDTYISDGNGNGVDRTIKYPRDEGSHDEPYEFWRAVFLLFSTGGDRFGISTTYTKNSPDFGGTNQSQLLITDEGNVTGHEYYGRMTQGELHAEEGGLNLTYSTGEQTDYWRQTQGFNYTYQAAMFGGGMQIAYIDLTMEYMKPPILIGTNGKIFDAELNFGTIFGYSQTKLLVHGTLLLEGVSKEVGGHAWIDHQWGAWSYTSKEYWQLQMENGVDLSIFRLYGGTGLVYEHFYKVGLNGQVTDIDSYQLENLKYVIAPADALKKRCVASEWSLTSSTIDLDAQSSVIYQFSQAFGWEGTIHGSGTMDASFASGRGYALLHNAAISDPIIQNITDNYQDPGFPIPVTADILDGIPIVNATIYYNISGSSTIESTPMTFVGGNEWSGEIPPQPSFKTIYYYIVAFDLADKSVTSDIFQFYTG